MPGPVPFPTPSQNRPAGGSTVSNPVQLSLELIKPRLSRETGESPTLLICEGHTRLKLQFRNVRTLKRIAGEAVALARRGPHCQQLPLFKNVRPSRRMSQSFFLANPIVSRLDETLILRDEGMSLTLKFTSTDALRTFAANLAALAT